ncbi:6-carboxytetrahydropterin synthase [Neptunomonas antarctica]|uniref:6-carboxy-5,6,7,8-tetrahydropterin synthase n=1 Tax=Neptunomonas antarctica TaxID=619304 RepID=A0A1N7PLB9_9GAMM|nr:6-carboxytetrahydropterin synthase [Neptunomonas antarctica]SIT11392.1 6-pyruvoyl tetrahydropterin synthase [Neptunomonas antarctica]
MKLFVNNLTNVDFSYLHSSRGLMGESWLLQLELDGALNEQGMVCDFGVVKKLTREWMDSTIDHALLVPTKMNDIKIEHALGQTRVDWLYPNGKSFHCQSPSKAIVAVDVEEITPEAMAEWCRAQLIALFPQEVRGLNLRFVPEVIDGAFYHYSHGLQQHDGNCQRIAHGHRSRIEIFLNNERNHKLEQEWAARWHDIYIGTSAHRKESAEGMNTYEYRAPQGEFSLTLPTEYCSDIDTESTVEQIARHLAARIKQIRPLDDVMVRAYEGVGKGAVSQV